MKQTCSYIFLELQKFNFKIHLKFYTVMLLWSRIKSGGHPRAAKPLKSWKFRKTPKSAHCWTLLVASCQQRSLWTKLCTHRSPCPLVISPAVIFFLIVQCPPPRPHKHWTPPCPHKPPKSNHCWPSSDIRGGQLSTEIAWTKVICSPPLRWWWL